MPLLERMLAACRPQILILQGWTANDGPGELAAEAYAAKVLDMAGKARQLGTLPVLITRFARETLAQHPEELRAAQRQRDRQLALAGPDLPVLDAPLVLDDPARPGAYRLGLSNDHIHANDTGHAAVARLLTPLLRSVLARAG
jgi:lysophospholipase L1-like esterase